MMLPAVTCLMVAMDFYKIVLGDWLPGIPVVGSIHPSINDTRNHRNIDPDDGKILFGA
jgi:hypothetical protein